MRRSDSFEVAARGVIIFFSLCPVVCETRSAFFSLREAKQLRISVSYSKMLLQQWTRHRTWVLARQTFVCRNQTKVCCEAARAFCRHCVQTTYGWLSALAVAFQRGRETEFESFTVKRLGQNADCAPQKCLSADFLVGKGRDENYRHIVSMGTQFIKQLESAQNRHLDVRNHTCGPSQKR